MAEVIGSAWVEIKPRFSTFDNEVKRRIGGIGPTAQKEGEKHGRMFGSAFVRASAGPFRLFGGVLGPLSAALTAVAGIKALGGFIADARESARIGRVTANVIASTGGAAKVTAAQVGNLATAISNKTGKDDEAIQSGQNMLLTFTRVRNETGRGNDIFNQASSVLTDMTAAMNGGEVTSEGMSKQAIQLGKALNDPIQGMGALRRVGVTFDAQQQKQIKTMVASGNTLGAQRLILGELRKEFGGTAAASSDASDHFGVAVGNLREKIGGLLVPALSGLANVGTTRVIPAISAMLDALTTGRVTVGGFAGRLQYLVLTAKGVWSALTGGTVAPQAQNRFTMMASTARDLLVPAIGNLIASVRNLWTAIQPTVVTLARWGAAAAAVAVVIGVQLIAALRPATAFLAAHQGTIKLLTITILGIMGAMRAWAALIAVQAAATRAWAAVTAVATGATRAWSTAVAVANAVQAASRGTVATWIGVKAIEAGTWARGTAAAARDTVVKIANRAVHGVGWLLAFIAAKSAEALAWIRSTAVTVGNTAALVAHRAIAFAVAAATKVMTVAQWALNVALRANPIGIVITVLTLLVGAVILAYRHSQRFRDIVQAAWRGIQAAVSFAWNNVIKPIFNAYVAYIRGVLIPVVLFLWRNVILPTFRAIGSHISFVWRNVILPTFNALRAGINTVRAAFSTGVTAIGRIWDGIREKTKRPVNFVIGIYNRGIVDVWNRVAGLVGLGKLTNIKPLAQGGTFGTYNAPTAIVGEGNPAHPEYVIPTDPKYRGRALGLYESLGTQLMRRGGILGTIERVIKGTASAAVSSSKSVLGFFKNPVSAILDLLKAPLRGLSQIRSTMFGNLISRIPELIVNKLIAWGRDKIKAKLSGGGPINPGLNGALAWARTQVGKPYNWGGVGPGGYDCSGFMSAITNVIKGRSPYSRLFSTGSFPQAGFVPNLPSAFRVGWFVGSPGHMAGTLNGVNVESAGGVGVRVGRSARGANNGLFRRRAGLKGYQRGGRLGDPPFDVLDPRGQRYAGFDFRPLLYDNGGILPPGVTMAVNRTGRGERVTPAGEAQHIHVHLHNEGAIITRSDRELQTMVVKAVEKAFGRGRIVVRTT